MKLKGIKAYTGKIVAAVLTAAMTASVALPAYADTQTDLKAAKERQQQAESSLDAKQDSISSLQTEKGNLESYLGDLNTQLNDLSDQLTEVSNQLSQKETEIEQTRAAVERAKLTEDRQYEQMKNRIQYMYENGQDDLLVTVLSSKNVTEMLNRATEFEEITTYDRNQLQEYQEAKEAVIEQEASLEKEEASLKTLKTEREQKRAEVRNVAAQTDQKIQAYTANISQEELEASSLQQKIKEQKENVAALQQKADAEEKARQEAAAKAAAVEKLAAQKAAEDKAAKEAAVKAQSQEPTGTEAESKEETKETPVATGAAKKAEADPVREQEEAEPEEQEKHDHAASQGKFLGTFKLTAYCPCAICCGRANQPTASGSMPVAGHTVAMAGVPFGTKLLINGTVYTVEDLGTPYGHVDIFMNSHSQALAFGLQYADVYQVG